MFIYTGNCAGKKLEKLKKYNMGIMISTRADKFPEKHFNQVPCALDNGAFSFYQKGYPFQPDLFLKTISMAYKHNIKLDFIVCPDIVTGGVDSLRFSIKWARGILFGTPNLALVVQDGMKPNDITPFHLQYFSYLFIGGTTGWKWQMAETWVKFAKDNDKKIHIGKCGTLENLYRAQALGVDSVDSTNFARNDSFNVVAKFMDKSQVEIFNDDTAIGDAVGN